MKNFFSSNRNIVLALSIMAALAPLSAYAATVTVSSPQAHGSAGNEYRISIDLDAEGQSVNAVSGTLIFPESLLAFKGMNDANSAINLWISRPRSDTSGSVTFSGIIPGGYTGALGHIATLIFQAVRPGTGEMHIAALRALKNDGKGTSLSTSSAPFDFDISTSAAGDTQSDIDRDPPLPFIVKATHSPQAFNGAYFITFAATDKGSGINHYEVKEGGQPFARAESPYRLNDQSLSKPVLVAAVDNSGNRRVESYIPAPSLWPALIVALIALCVVSLAIYMAKKRRASA